MSPSALDPAGARGGDSIAGRVRTTVVKQVEGQFAAALNAVVCERPLRPALRRSVPSRPLDIASGPIGRTLLILALPVLAEQLLNTLVR